MKDLLWQNQHMLRALQQIAKSWPLKGPNPALQALAELPRREAVVAISQGEELTVERALHILALAEFPKDGLNFNDTATAFKMLLIERAMQRGQGFKSRTAPLLGIGYTTLCEQVAKLFGPGYKFPRCSNQKQSH